jgi:hypothetical protein
MDDIIIMPIEVLVEEEIGCFKFDLSFIKENSQETIKKLRKLIYATKREARTFEINNLVFVRYKFIIEEKTLKEVYGETIQSIFNGMTDDGFELIFTK